MILTLGFLGILVAGIIIAILVDDIFEGAMGMLGFIFMLIGGVTFLAIVICIIFNPIGVKAEIVKFEATSDAIHTARANPDISPFELAALQREVVATNRWLANGQYWAKHKLTNWFWPKVILTIEPIR